MPCRPLRIAVVTETYPPEINGVAMTLGRMVEGMLARGHSIQLIRPRQRKDELPCRRGSLEEVLAPGVPLPRYPNLRLGLPVKHRLLGLWSAHRPQAVLIATEGPLGWSALAAARALGLPVASEFHTNFHQYSHHYGFGWFHRAIAAYLRRFHNRADTTLVPTAALRTRLLAEGYRGVHVVARGVDIRLFHPCRRSRRLRAAWGAGDADPVVLYVGRLAPEKNIPLVLRAYDAIAAAQPRARLVLVGDGPARAALEAGGSRAVFAGVRTGEDLARHYASADVFLFPSETETYGNVTAEALASGLAVAAYDYAAAAELVRDGENGALAPLGHADAFVAAACRLAQDAEGRMARAARARASVEHLDWEQVVAELLRVMGDIVADRAKPCGSEHAIVHAPDQCP
ncbi:MAG: glycosyltransferase family 1 protein [Pseudomonadota bacterium]|jgi:glycosyltransferase involved in cell wall biosynthesis